MKEAGGEAYRTCVARRGTLVVRWFWSRRIAATRHPRFATATAAFVMWWRASEVPFVLTESIAGTGSRGRFRKSLSPRKACSHSLMDGGRRFAFRPWALAAHEFSSARRKSSRDERTPAAVGAGASSGPPWSPVDAFAILVGLRSMARLCTLEAHSPCIACGKV